MNISKKHEDAMAALLELTPQQIQELNHKALNHKLTHEEAQKDHGLRNLRFTTDEFETFCQHLHDGGGVVSDEVLVEELNQAIHDRDQAAFWPALVHLAKARLKIRDQVRVHPGGATAIRGTAKANQLAIPSNRR